MGEQASTMAHCRLSLLILLVSLVQISQSRKTAETGGGAGGEGGGTCQEVYITIYQQGVTDKIGLDYGQAEDDGVTMISSLLAEYGCTNATAEGHEPYFENTCDDDDDYDTCAKVETSWNCLVEPTAWAAFSAGAFTLNSPVGDDCAPEPKCGGPVGAQTCSYTPLPSASVFPTALKISEWGSVHGMRDEGGLLPEVLRCAFVLDRMGLCYHTTNRNHNIRDPVHRECSDVGSLDCASSCAHIAGAGYANVRIMAASPPTH